MLRGPSIHREPTRVGTTVVTTAARASLIVGRSPSRSRSPPSSCRLGQARGRRSRYQATDSQECSGEDGKPTRNAGTDHLRSGRPACSGPAVVLGQDRPRCRYQRLRHYRHSLARRSDLPQVVSYEEACLIPERHDHGQTRARSMSSRRRTPAPTHRVIAGNSRPRMVHTTPAPSSVTTAYAAMGIGSSA